MIKRIVAAVVLLAVGILVGRLIGAAEVYKKTSHDLDEQYYGWSTVNLKSHFALLELLDSHQEQKAAQKLARLVDVDLLALKRSSRETKRLPPETMALMKRAEEYRQAQRATEKGRAKGPAQDQKVKKQDLTPGKK